MESLRAKLKAATLASHTKIESNPTLSKLTSKTLTEPEYRSILEGYFGFFSALEQNFQNQPTHSSIPAFQERLRTRRLKADLHSLGQTVSEIESLKRCSQLPSVQTESEFLGVMYVTEGSTLGGMLIAKHLKTLPFMTLENASFFTEEPHVVSARWKSFIEHLEARSSELNEDITLRAATETFQKLDQWMAACGSERTFTSVGS